MKAKNKWLAISDKQVGIKQNRECKHVDLEKALFLWFSEMRAKNAVISDENLREKAHVFGEKLGVSEEDFRYSKGWLARFKNH